MALHSRMQFGAYFGYNKMYIFFVYYTMHAWDFYILHNNVIVTCNGHIRNQLQNFDTESL